MSCHESLNEPSYSRAKLATKLYQKKIITLPDKVKSHLPILQNVHKTDENSPLIFQKEQF
jgi:hypothetical protein